MQNVSNLFAFVLHMGTLDGSFSSVMPFPYVGIALTLHRENQLLQLCSYVSL